MNDSIAEEFDEPSSSRDRGLLLVALPPLLLAALGKPERLFDRRRLAAGVRRRGCPRAGPSGTRASTTRGDRVTAPALVTAGPYAYVRNPLYVGNFITALGFTMAFTGKNSTLERCALVAAALGSMAGIYATIVPHEEHYLRERFGDDFDRYCERVPRILPQLDPAPDGEQTWDPNVIANAESKTFLTFGAMLALLALKSIAA